MMAGDNGYEFNMAAFDDEVCVAVTTFMQKQSEWFTEIKKEMTAACDFFKQGGNAMESSEHTVLCVDDERNILNAIRRLVRKENYRLLTAGNGPEGLEVLSQNEVHVVISDQRMPGMNGTEFLKQVKELYPDIIRIILTGYTDVDSITEAINEGSVYKFFLKPWNDHNLKLEVRQALEQYDLVQTNKRLHEKVLAQNQELKDINESLEDTVVERTQSLEIQNRALQLSQAVLDDLSLPILGISNEMIIVLANKAARNLDLCDHPVSVGDSLGVYFETPTEQWLAGRMAEQKQVRCSGVCKKRQRVSNGNDSAFRPFQRKRHDRNPFAGSRRPQPGSRGRTAWMHSLWRNSSLKRKNWSSSWSTMVRRSAARPPT